LITFTGRNTVDIFAQSGSAVHVHELEVIFDSPDSYGKRHDWAGYSVHDAATCLLRYLKRLPEPVIPLQDYNKFTSIDIEAIVAEGESAIGEAIRQFQQYITELPPLSRQLLLYLLEICAVFAYESDVNKMTSPRIIAAFQPSLLARDPSIGMSADDHRRAALTLVFMIENQDHFLIGMRGTAADECETVKDEELAVPDEGDQVPDPEFSSEDEDKPEDPASIDKNSTNTISLRKIARKPVPATHRKSGAWIELESAQDQMCKAISWPVGH
jgi:hypothetical protein